MDGDEEAGWESGGGAENVMMMMMMMMMMIPKKSSGAINARYRQGRNLSKKGEKISTGDV